MTTPAVLGTDGPRPSIGRGGPVPRTTLGGAGAVTVGTAAAGIRGVCVGVVALDPEGDMGVWEF
jgi:hypothetical protein